MRQSPVSRPRPTFHRHAVCDGCHEPTDYPTKIGTGHLCDGCLYRLRETARRRKPKKSPTEDVREAFRNEARRKARR